MVWRLISSLADSAEALSRFIVDTTVGWPSGGTARYDTVFMRDGTKQLS